MLAYLLIDNLKLGFESKLAEKEISMNGTQRVHQTAL